jgi:hypothetical protein
MAQFNERFQAIEGQVVRLYFRNFVGNILTNVDGGTSPLLSVSIRAQGSTANLASSLPIVHESVGTYYADYSVPSSDPASPKFDVSWPGPGFFQDVWKGTIGTIQQTFAQDFFVLSEAQLTVQNSVITPIRFNQILQPTRLESGARDFVSVIINESNGVLVANQDVFPEGQVQLFFGDLVIFNYRPLIHAPTSNEYSFFLNTTELRQGVYKVQTKHEIPAGIVDSRATVLSTQSLASGFVPASTALLDLTADGIKHTVVFPPTSTPAEILGVFLDPPTFIASSNDLLRVDIDSTLRERRILNGTIGRGIDDLITEMNGSFPTPAFTGFSGLTLPTLTSSVDATALDVSGKTLTINVDNVFTSLTFPSGTTTGIAIATAITAAGIKSEFANTRLVISPIGAKSVTIDGGTAALPLGFASGQNDGSRNGLKVNATDAKVALRGNLISVDGLANAGDLETIKLDDGVVSTTFTFILPYNATLPYSINDKVYFNNLLFQASASISSGEAPDSSPNDWVEIANENFVQVGPLALDSLTNFRDKTNNHPNAYFQSRLTSDSLNLGIYSRANRDMVAVVTTTVWDSLLNIVLKGSESLRVLSPGEGSVANDSLGFVAGGESATTIAATSSSISGTNVFPIVTVNPTAANIASGSLVSFSGLTLGGKNFRFFVDGDQILTTFTNTLLPAAITALNAFGSFGFIEGNNDVLTIRYSRNSGSTITTITTDLATVTGNRTISEVVVDLNVKFATVTDEQDGPNKADTYIVADTFGGSLRIRARNIADWNTGILEIDTASLAYTILGFNGVESDPAGTFQNDQVILETGAPLGGTAALRALDYIDPFSLQEVADAINVNSQTALSYDAVSIINNSLFLESNTLGAASKIQVDNTTGSSALSFSDFTEKTGVDGSGYELLIDVNGSGDQTVTFANGKNSAADVVGAIINQTTNVNSQVNISGGITVSDSSGGANRPLKLSVNVNDLSFLGFAAVTETTVTNGSDSVPAIVFSTKTPASSYVSVGNGILKIRTDIENDFVTVNLSAAQAAADIVNEINTAMVIAGFPNIVASYTTPNFRITDTVNLGDDSFIEVGTFDDGSNANLAVGLSQNGVGATGSEGTEYSLEDIVGRINAVFGGNQVAQVNANFLQLQSIQTGAGASLTIGTSTTSNITSIWGLSKGTFFGSSRTQSAQTIVSPRLTLIVGT